MKFRTWLGALALVAAVTPSAFAQVDQGRITGTVRDASNAFVAGTVKVKNARTGDERSTVTNAQGYFLVSGLKPSSYTVKVEHRISADRVPEMTLLAVGPGTGPDFELKPAGVQEAVTVVGTAPVLDISSARLGVNVSEREVSELPVNGRQMSQLMLQAPGAQNAGTGTWQDVRFSGRANEQNVIKYDGVEGSAIIDASPGNVNGETNTPFKLQASLENVQEFRVESSSYPAEYGTGTGGQVSVITKSGANNVHGAVFEYPPEREIRQAELLRLAEKRGWRRGRLPRQVAAEAEPVRRLGRRPARQGQGVLLRQLRRLPAGRRQELRRGRAERLGLGPRRAGRGRPALRISRARRGDPAGRVDQPGLRHRAAPAEPDRSRKTRSAAASTSR